MLLNQIMQLSPAQIDGLPPEQKAQVLALQQQMVSLLLIPLCCGYNTMMHLNTSHTSVALVFAVVHSMHLQCCWIIRESSVSRSCIVSAKLAAASFAVCCMLSLPCMPVDIASTLCMSAKVQKQLALLSVACCHYRSASCHLHRTEA